MRAWARRALAALPWLAIGAVSCTVVLLVLLPAAWVTPQFAKATRGHVNLVDPAGSLWHGSATLMLAAGQDQDGATVLPGRIEWHTAFWPLLTGRVRMTMRHSRAMPQPIDVDASFVGATLSPGDMVVPASLLTGLGAPFNTLDLEGGVRVKWTQWHLFRNGTFGQVAIMLDDMSSRVSTVKPLGSYRAVFQAQGGVSTIDLSTLKGPLLLDGHGTVAKGVVSFHGEASAAPEARDTLAGLLTLLGQPTGSGSVALNFTR